jgi:hypothetical protein
MIGRVFVASLMMFATPAYADQYYLVLDRVSHKCLIVHNRPSPGMRLLGIYRSEAEGRAVMATRTECRSSLR